MQRTIIDNETDYEAIIYSRDNRLGIQVGNGAWTEWTVSEVRQLVEGMNDFLDEIGEW